MKTMIILITVLIAATGCASNGDADTRAADKYQRVEAQCSRDKGTMIIKRTGTRIRKPYSREALLTARCDY